MRGWLNLVLAVAIAGCSDLTEGAGGVVELEISSPALSIIEVGESLQLTARGLDRDGNPVSVPVTWQATDATLTVDATTGVVTGVAPGIGGVQALVGSLSSAALSFTVISPADTLVLAGDSVLTVAPEAPTSPPLLTRLETFSPAGPLENRPVVYEITSPPDIGPHSVELPGGVLIDTLSTDADGTIQAAILQRVAGIPQPDTAIVEVRAFRTRGAAVPGSGQRFIVIFQ